MKLYRFSPIDTKSSDDPNQKYFKLYEPDIDALCYVSTNVMSEKVRTKLSEETKL